MKARTTWVHKSRVSREIWLAVYFHFVLIYSICSDCEYMYCQFNITAVLVLVTLGGRVRYCQYRI